jgi:hypothetical protein
VFIETWSKSDASDFIATPEVNLMCELSCAVVHLVRSMDSYSNVLGDPLIFWTLRAEAD